MKVTYKWLKDFVDIDMPAEMLASKLTNAGMEVEEIIYLNEHLHHVVVGKILKIEKHPNADKLQVCQVDIGKQIVQIITSAANIFQGAVVPVSLEGADLVNGVKIAKSKLRGVDSDGMFCSGEELGIDDNFMPGASINGILILPDDFIIGQDIDVALGLDDIVFDVGITPNRPDCMSVIGLAREVCAVTGAKFKKPDLSYKESSIKNDMSVELKSEKCSRYMAAVLKNVKIERSPLKIRQRLFAVGIKPINTIVDLTNYVLVEMGQPMHAFDQSFIEGRKIVVRDAVRGEKLAVLNHNTYVLDSSDLVIADSKKPMVIAGVIGGTNSCISNETRDAVIESAVFDLKAIRLTSKKIGVRTDSSARYSKGVYFHSAEDGLKRFLNLAYSLGVGDICQGIVDKNRGTCESRVIKAKAKNINAILGTNISVNDMVTILNSLQIPTKLESDAMIVNVPDFREDLENEYDIAEEVIRIYGYDVYDRGEAREAYLGWKLTQGDYSKKVLLERKIKEALKYSGFFEAMNYSFIPPDSVTKLMLTDNRRFMIKIANPIGEELSCMRTSLAHSMLSSLAYNFSVGNKEVRLFESGKTFHPNALPLTELPIETNKISMGAYDITFAEFKACVENAITETGLSYKLVRSKEPFLHPGVSADVVDDNGEIYASFGQVHPTVAKNYNIPKTSMFAEIDLDKLLTLPEKKFVIKQVPKFPIVDRDLAIVVKEEISNADLESAIRSACGKIFYDVKLFDVYRNKTLGDGLKSMAYNIRLANEDKTLTDEEVTETIAKVLKALKFRYGASLR